MRFIEWTYLIRFRRVKIAGRAYYQFQIRVKDEWVEAVRLRDFLKGLEIAESELEQENKEE